MIAPGVRVCEGGIHIPFMAAWVTKLQYHVRIFFSSTRMIDSVLWNCFSLIVVATVCLVIGVTAIG